MYLYWQLSDEEPDLGSYGDGGVDGLGDEWTQPFVKGLFLGVLRVGKRQELWICSKSNDENGTEKMPWVKATDFIGDDPLPKFQSFI